ARRWRHAWRAAMVLADPRTALAGGLGPDRRGERSAAGHTVAAPHELAGELDLLAARRHHAELGAGLAVDAGERPERGQLHPEPAPRLLDLRPRHAQAVEAVGHPHLLDAQADHAEHEGHEEPGAAQRGGHRPEAPAVALAVEPGGLLGAAGFAG